MWWINTLRASAGRTRPRALRTRALSAIGMGARRQGLAGLWRALESYSVLSSLRYPASLDNFAGSEIGPPKATRRGHARDGVHQSPGCAFRGEPAQRVDPCAALPCFAWAPAQAFPGLGVRRDNSPPDCCLPPAHSPDLRLSLPHPPDLPLYPLRPCPARFGPPLCGVPNRSRRFWSNLWISLNGQRFESPHLAALEVAEAWRGPVIVWRALEDSNL